MSIFFSDASIRRRAIMQLILSFLTPPEAAIWQQLTDEQRQTVIDQLAHLVAKSAIGAARQEARDD
jgi:hypothetical protein